MQSTNLPHHEFDKKGCETFACISKCVLNEMFSKEWRATSVHDRDLIFQSAPTFQTQALSLSAAP